MRAGEERETKTRPVERAPVNLNTSEVEKQVHDLLRYNFRRGVNAKRK